MVGDQVPGADDLRARAIQRLKDKHDFKVHLFWFLTINAGLVVVWAITGGLTTAAGSVTSFFWPAFPILGWGIGIVAHWYSVYHVESYTESDIQREMDRLKR